MSDPNLSSFIWSVADLLRGDYKQSEYGKVRGVVNVSAGHADIIDMCGLVSTRRAKAIVIRLTSVCARAPSRQGGHY